MSSGITEANDAGARDVYARLYDKRSYTGVYRKRFEGECHDLSECVVHDLSNTMRTNLKYDVDPRTKRMSSPRLNIPSANLNAPVETAPMMSPHEKPSEPSPMQLRGDPNDPHTLLKAVFHYYCRFGRTGAKGAGEKTLDNANFSKLCRDSPDLLGPTFSTTDVDLIFIKAKKKGERRINYTRFLDALGMIAMQKYSDLSLEASVPKLLEAHLARLPCMMEFTNGKTVQAIWQKRAEREDPAASTELPSLPPLAPTQAPASNASAPEPSSGVSESTAEAEIPTTAALPPPAPTQMLSTPMQILAAPRGSSTPLDATTVAN
uniref:Uncharacterized protein n=1 Tax=Globisporangium ultimum (strain ATCC 200006 / CBS 805.95 / DAOM BR144) TaxID=431595 RepID=K3WU00_GLOUD